MIAEVLVDAQVCKGCRLCVEACPKHVLVLDTNQINARGYNPAVVAAPESCIGCGMCGIICPDSAITVRKEAP